MAKLIDAKTVKDLLPLEKLDMSNITQLEVTPIRYKPEDRCTTRYCIIGNKKNLILFGKTFKDHRGQALYDTLKPLWQWSCQPEILFQIAQPLSYSNSLKTLWQAALPGQALVHT